MKKKKKKINKLFEADLIDHLIINKELSYLIKRSIIQEVYEEFKRNYSKIFRVNYDLDIELIYKEFISQLIEKKDLHQIDEKVKQDRELLWAPNENIHESSLLQKPPVKATIMIDFILPPHDSPEVLGDLEEQYYCRQIKYGITYANKWYWNHAIRSVLDILFWRYTSKAKEIVGIVKNLSPF